MIKLAAKLPNGIYTRIWQPILLWLLYRVASVDSALLRLAMAKVTVLQDVPMARGERVTKLRELYPLHAHELLRECLNISIRVHSR